MSAKKPRLCLMMLLLVASKPLFSQCNIGDISPNLAEDSRDVVQNYLQEIEVSSNLNRGILHIKKYPADEHPFYYKNEWSAGNLIYDNVFYPDVLLKYDIESDQLISQNSLGVTFSLQKAKVSSFEIFDKVFISVRKDEDSYQFFELKHCGDVSVLIGWEKHFKEVREYPKVRFVYDQEEKYFLYKNDSLHQLTGKRSVHKYFEDHKKEVNDYAKGLERYSRDKRGDYFAELTAFYNNLIQGQ